MYVFPTVLSLEVVKRASIGYFVDALARWQLY
jgi:hypothetical protein